MLQLVKLIIVIVLGSLILDHMESAFYKWQGLPKPDPRW